MHAIAVIAITLLSFGTQTNQAAEQKSTESLSISGSVVNADSHAPLKNIQVVVSGPRTDGQAETTGDATDSESTTDEKGNFSFEKLKPGTYLLRASHAGMVMKGAGKSGLFVQLQTGHSENITLSMLQAGAITGRILNEQGEPMQNVSVAAMRFSYSQLGRQLLPIGNATSDDKGEYRIFGLKPGSYLLSAADTRSGESITRGARGGDKSGTNKIYAPTFYQNETSPDQALPIVVKSGDEARANFSLARVPAYRVSGKVTGLGPLKEGEQQIRYVAVMQQGMMAQPIMAMVGKDSSFELPAIASGKYMLMAIDMDRKEEGGGPKTGFRDIEVGTSDVTGITIDLNPTRGQVNGVVRTSEEAHIDLTSLYVAFMPAPNDSSAPQNNLAEEFRGGAGYAAVKSDGSFKADIAASANNVYALIAAQGGGLEDWFTSKVLLNGKDVFESGFKVADAQRGRIEIILSTKGGAIEGAVQDSQEKPVPNAQIIAFPSDSKLRRRYDLLQKATSDQKGHFKLRGLHPGEYTVMALEDDTDQPFAEDVFLKQNADKIRTLKVGQSTEHIQLQLISEGQ